MGFMQGCLKPITVRIPPGSILSPSPTAAVVGGNVLTSQRVTDVVLKAFNAAAASQVHTCHLTAILDTARRAFHTQHLHVLLQNCTVSEIECLRPSNNTPQSRLTRADGSALGSFVWEEAKGAVSGKDLDACSKGA